MKWKLEEWSLTPLEYIWSCQKVIVFFFPIKFKIAVIFLKYLLTYINFAKKVIYKKSADFILILLFVVRKEFLHVTILREMPSKVKKSENLLMWL